MIYKPQWFVICYVEFIEEMLAIFDIDVNFALDKKEYELIFKAMEEYIHSIYKIDKKNICVTVDNSNLIYFGGERGKIAVCGIQIDNNLLTRESNSLFSEKVSDFLLKNFNISPTKYEIKYVGHYTSQNIE